jgi:hypothetical protein
MINNHTFKESVEKEMNNILSNSSIAECIHSAMFSSINISILHIQNQISHEEYISLLNKTKQLITRVIQEKFSKTSLN